MSVNVTLMLFQFFSHLVPWFKGIVCEGDIGAAHLRRVPEQMCVSCVTGVRACVCVCVCPRSTYGVNELHYHFKASSQQYEVLSSINVILGRERGSETQRETHRAAVIITLEVGKRFRLFISFSVSDNHLPHPSVLS